jgi:hypothetical protein
VAIILVITGLELKTYRERTSYNNYFMVLLFLLCSSYNNGQYTLEIDITRKREIKKINSG